MDFLNKYYNDKKPLTGLFGDFVKKIKGWL